MAGAYGLYVNSNQAGQGQESTPTPEVSPTSTPEPPIPRKDAVLVLGASGRVGRQLVLQLVQSGRTVIACVRSSEKASLLFEQLGLKQGYQSPENKGGVLVVEGGLDVCAEGGLPARIWEGVSQVAISLGGVFGPLPEGGFGVLEGLSSEKVEGIAIPALMASLPANLPKSAYTDTQVLSMTTPEALSVWSPLDDNIMGGTSLSSMALSADGTGALWTGQLVVEGGGFCGARTSPMTPPLSLPGTDGLALRVRGDGQTYKMGLWTTGGPGGKELSYQTTFTTGGDGQWREVVLPWHSFVCCEQAQSVEGPPVNPCSITRFSFILSRFQFNKMSNPNHKPGPFSLEIQGGVRAYTAVKPQIVLVSSAGVERNAIIGDDPIKRKADIPIVQLNPGATLNHKYAAEIAVRESGYPYCVVRSTGMTDKNEGAPFLMEASQGDRISGGISRGEVAAAMVAALGSPLAAGKTFELRRNESADSKGKDMSAALWVNLLSGVAHDVDRWHVGLPPFPKYAPPPPPATEERTKEILADARVVASATEQQALRDARQKERELVAAQATKSA